MVEEQEPPWRLVYNGTNLSLGLSATAVEIRFQHEFQRFTDIQAIEQSAHAVAYDPCWMVSIAECTPLFFCLIVDGVYIYHE